MANNNQKNYNLKNPDGSITYLYNDEQAIIEFYENNENIPSELMEFKFVVDSYFESCWLLLSEVEKYALVEDFRTKKMLLTKYLPAIFCFRHYLELKLKYLYMKHTAKAFNTNEHTLTKLLEELQNASGLEYSIFNNAISYVQEIEKTKNNENFDAFSRYLVDKKFNFSKKLSIVIDDIKRMKRSLVEIEGRIEQRDQIQWFNNLLKQSKTL